MRISHLHIKKLQAVVCFQQCQPKNHRDLIQVLFLPSQEQRPRWLNCIQDRALLVLPYHQKPNYFRASLVALQPHITQFLPKWELLLLQEKKTPKDLTKPTTPLSPTFVKIRTHRRHNSFSLVTSLKHSPYLSRVNQKSKFPPIRQGSARSEGAPSKLPAPSSSTFLVSGKTPSYPTYIYRQPK